VTIRAVIRARIKNPAALHKLAVIEAGNPKSEGRNQKETGRPKSEAKAMLMALMAMPMAEEKRKSWNKAEPAVIFGLRISFPPRLPEGGTPSVARPPSAQ